MLIYILIGIFLILHGLVHVIYAGQSLHLFQMRPGMVWPDGSWFFSKLFGDAATRIFVSVALALTALGLMAGGVGLLLRQGWFRPVVIGAAVLSSLIFLLAWDGKMNDLDAKGGIGLLINAVILVVILIIKLPIL